MKINITKIIKPTIKTWIRRMCGAWKLGISTIIAFLLTGMVVLGMETVQREHLLGVQESLASEVLRFHVLANSDSEEDQALKMQVKDAVIAYMKASMKTSNSTTNSTATDSTTTDSAATDSVESDSTVTDSAATDSTETDSTATKESQADLLASKVWVENHRVEIKDICEDIIANAGYDYPVTVELTESYFPVKTYGDITFPKGEYEALKIQIGEAKGQNWWCCLYPNLCFIDATYGVVSEEGKEDLQEVLTDEEYNMITTTSKVKIKWFFFGK